MNMKLSSRIAASILALGLLAPAGVAFAQYGGYPAPPPQYPPVNYGARGWDAPPTELQQFQRQGYLDGLQGAERDFQNHRIWNVNNRDEYRHPRVPGNVRGDYRDGFRKGYNAGASHYQGGR